MIMKSSVQPPRRRPSLKDKKREETRANLVAAAKRLFSQYGYEDVPVTEIAREAGVTHSMINVYFGGKTGLLYEIVRENNAPQFDESIRITQQDKPAFARLSEMLLFWTESDGADPKLLSRMQSYSWVWPPEVEADNASDRSRYIDLVAGLIREAQLSGEVSATPDPHLTAEAVFAVYTWELRSIVFERVTPERCHANIMEKVGLLLSPARQGGK
jgi:AcrR family transcriptional regulator